MKNKTRGEAGFLSSALRNTNKYEFTNDYGRSEKVYQRAVALGLKDSGLEFKEQFYMPLIYKNKQIGNNRFDFLIADKMILEIKKGDRFIKSHIDQVYSYLVGSNLKLGILAYFAPRNLHFKRIVNL